MLDLPSTRARRSSASSTHSAVRPRQNSPGWITKGSSAPTVTSSVRSFGGSRRSIAEVRKLWKTRNESPRRRSTLAGWTIAGSHGSTTMRPSSTRRLMVPSERAATAAVCRAVRLAVRELATAGGDRADAGRRRGGRLGVRAAAGARRAGVPRVRIGLRLVLGAAVALLGGLRGLVDGPPDDVEEPRDGDLQGEHQEDEGRGHASAHPTPARD